MIWHLQCSLHVVLYSKDLLMCICYLLNVWLCDTMKELEPQLFYRIAFEAIEIIF